jgi:hypothetical protein
MNASRSRAGAVAVLVLLAGCQPPSESGPADQPGAYENVADELVTNGPFGTVTAQYSDSPRARASPT